jgi:hypothetical protein
MSARRCVVHTHAGDHRVKDLTEMSYGLVHAKHATLPNVP